MPGVDLCAAGICRKGSALLPEEGNQATAAQGRIYLGGGEVRLAVRSSGARLGSHDQITRAILPYRAQCTQVKNRAKRKPDSHVDTGWYRMPRSHDARTASARPTRSSIGSRPTP